MPLFLIMALVVNGCRHTDNHVQLIVDSTGSITAIRLSPDAAERAGVKLGSITKQVVDKWAPCSGYLTVAPESNIGIPSPAAGRITSVFCAIGHHVKAGTIMASLENIDFITLQQEYLDAENQYDFLHEEYTRQGELTVENATSVKKMQIARRDYQSAELKLHALRSQLEILGIFPDSLKLEKMSPVIHILAPGSGIISGVGIHKGSYVEKGTPLFELINIQHILAKIYVPEQYIQHIEIGQFVHLWLAHDSLSFFKAKVLSIEPEINPMSHCATVYTEIAETKVPLISGMAIKAKIQLKKDTTRIINSNSLLHNPMGDYLYVKKQGAYTRIPVTTGNTFGEMTEIINFPVEITDSVVTKGVEYLNSLYKSK